MGKQRDILDSLKKINEERKNELNEQLDADIDWNKVQNAVDSYQNDVKKALSKYRRVIEDELPESYRDALEDSKMDLLYDDIRRVSYSISWMDIIDASQIEAYIEQNLQ